MSARTTLLIVGLLSSGLMAGFFYAWRVSVIPGTRLVDDNAYVSTMQHINREIVNPAFVGPFMLTPLVLAGAAWLQFRNGDTRKGWFLASAAATYVIGVLAVTIGGNIPLNDKLEAFSLAAADPAAVATQRRDYEGAWNRWHDLRTLGSLAAFALVAVAGVLEEAES